MQYFSRRTPNGLAANHAKLFHMGMQAPPARSTLADALNRRDWRISHALAQRLTARARALYAQEPSVLELDASVYALDSTTIDLCLSRFDWAPFRSTKAAVKLHDVNVLDILPVEAGAFYVMDRGYVDFARLYAMHQAGAFFVTRAKIGMEARRVYSSPTQRDTGVMLNGFYSAKAYLEHLRRIRFKDPESGKTLVFPTNNTTLPALTIAALYKSRWQVELFFESSTWRTPSDAMRFQGPTEMSRPLVGSLDRSVSPRMARRLLHAESRCARAGLGRRQVFQSNQSQDGGRRDAEPNGHVTHGYLCASLPLRCLRRFRRYS